MTSAVHADGTFRKNPEEDFELQEKLGEGSYGSVWEAKHRSTGQLVAIKRVPIENDYEDLLKEIQHMKQCESEAIVKCYSSYYYGAELWIAMEVCAAGSAADIMKVCDKPFSEPQIAQIAAASVAGLVYLHEKMRKIHRDIKAGNLLVNVKGEVKLADFGVTGQMAENTKRHTVIGTPFWMAPELIQEQGYNDKADIWSLGITMIELADMCPPYSDIHPMRAIFMIPSKPPPTVKEPSKFSSAFNEFVAKALIKNPEQRFKATALQQHAFVAGASGPAVLLDIVAEELEIIKRIGRDAALGLEEDDDDVDEPASDVFADGDGQGTTIVRMSRVLDDACDDYGTMVVRSNTGTMVVNNDGTGTMVITDSNATGTMKSNDVGEENYVPQWRAAMAEADAQASSTKFANFTVEQLKRLIADLEEKKQNEIDAIKQKYKNNRAAILEQITKS